MMNALIHSWYMTIRHLRMLSRQPWLIAITLVQPVIWLGLFGALFKRIIEIPGFAASSYLDFLTPGIVVMSALFTGGWAGTSIIEDYNRGVLDRFLVSPVHRGALIAGPLMQQIVSIIVQAAIILLLGLAMGARFAGGLTGALVLTACTVLLGAAFGALSNGLALLARKGEAVVVAVQFVALPLTFLSSGFMQQDLMPGWIRTIARFNPVNWAVEAGREALGEGVDWGFVFSRGGYLLLFMVLCAWLAVRAFRAYQRSI